MITKYTSDDINRILSYEMSDDMCASQKISILMHKLKIWNWQLDNKTKIPSHKAPQASIFSPEELEIFIANINALIYAAKTQIEFLKSTQE
jgi:hypothetical protein